jgi:phospholipid-translocating ATPase
MGKEAYDDYKRNLRDCEANSARYLVLASGASSPSDEEELSHSLLESDFLPTCSIPSSFIRVSDLVLLEKNQRVPANLIHYARPTRRELLHLHRPTGWQD